MTLSCIVRMDLSRVSGQISKYYSGYNLKVLRFRGLLIGSFDLTRKVD